MIKTSRFGSVPPPTGAAAGQHISKLKKTLDYFEDSDDEPPVTSTTESLHNEEADPLDLFMANVTEEVKKQENRSNTEIEAPPEIVSGANDIFDYDSEEYVVPVFGEDVENDSDGGPADGATEAKKRIEPLPALEHSTISYTKFEKSFYKENAEISGMTDSEVSQLRSDMDLQVSGCGKTDIRPISAFAQARFPHKLQEEIRRMGLEAPTAIQSQALPVILSGRDVIGLAKTGSGKTFAFLWPMIVHVLDQPQMRSGDGPIGLILTPTRELTTQIHNESKPFCKLFNVRSCAIIGGAGKWEMTKALKEETPEIVIATPGRLIELIRNKATNLRRCTMVVLDEADRMFEMGFEYQMRSIVNNIRPDRQTLLFSATMKKKVESFARDILNEPVRIVVGTIGQANPDIQQVVEVLPADDSSRWRWLSRRADEFVAEGKVIVFVGGKATTEELAKKLREWFAARQLDVGIASLHGDLDQGDRMSVMKRFSSKLDKVSILVATDVAARGLDVKGIRTVINYDVPKNIETYVHRIGRTGRMGLEGVVPGTAYTLVTARDSSFAVDLVNNLRLSNQAVTPELLRLAESSSKQHLLRTQRSSSSGGGSNPFANRKAGNSNGPKGIGFGDSGSRPVAMTSAMAAAQSQESRVAIEVGHETLIADVKGNKYLEGQTMGRGRQLTQPAWISTNNSSSFSSSGSSDLPDRDNNSASRRSKPSRFSAAAPSGSIPSVPVLKGFVKAATSYSSVDSEHCSSNSEFHRTEGQYPKKSRWE